MNETSFSIIVAVRNGAETLQRAIDSVKSQTYPHVELIVIDGKSSDNTVEVIRANEQHVAFWESEPDRGLYHAWNKGLDHVHGDWINFLGADDYFAGPEVLAEVAEAISGLSPHIRIVYTREAICSSTGTVLEYHGDPWEKARIKLMQRMSIPHGQVFHHKTLFTEHGKFDESFRIAGDYEFILRELKGGSAKFLPNIVAKCITLGGLSNSPDKVLALTLEYARAKRLHGIFPYDPASLWFLTKNVVKFGLYKLIGSSRSDRLVDSYRRLTGRVPLWTRRS